MNHTCWLKGPEWYCPRLEPVKETSWTFRLQVKGLRQGTKVCFYRGVHEEFKDFFPQEDGVVFCSDVCSVMEVLGHEFNPDQWRLFIESSKVSL